MKHVGINLPNSLGTDKEQTQVCPEVQFLGKFGDKTVPSDPVDRLPQGAEYMQSYTTKSNIISKGLKRIKRNYCSNFYLDNSVKPYSIQVCHHLPYCKLELNSPKKKCIIKRIKSILPKESSQQSSHNQIVQSVSHPMTGPTKVIINK